MSASTDAGWIPANAASETSGSPRGNRCRSGGRAFSDWSDERLVLDSMLAREANLRTALDYLTSARG